MRGRYLLLASLLVVMVPISCTAAPFSMFPKAGRVVSPDGRFEIRDVDETGTPGQFRGTFHALWVIEAATGNSRKLCGYFGLAAVAWAERDSIILTQYVAKKTSRALVFTSPMGGESYVLDSPGLINMLPVELRPTLRENDHLFVEASSLERDIFRFRVWGYGKHDPGGFRWNCEEALSDGRASCKPAGR